MKKFFVLVLLLASIVRPGRAQITDDDVRGLAGMAQTENWKSVYVRSSELLKTASVDTSDTRAMVVYYNILSAAGMRTRGELKNKDVEKAVMKYRGQRVIMAAHPVTTVEGSLSQTKFTVNDTTREAFTAVANARGTTILSLERCMLAGTPDVSAAAEGSMVRCGGTIGNIDLNDDKSLLWVLRLTVIGGFLRTVN